MLSETTHFKLYTPFKNYYIQTPSSYKSFIDKINHKIKMPQEFDLYYVDKSNLIKGIKEIAVNEENFLKFSTQNGVEVKARLKEKREKSDFMFKSIVKRICFLNTKNFLKNVTRKVRENRKEKAREIIKKFNPFPAKVILLKKMMVTKKIPDIVINEQNEEENQLSQMSIDKEQNNSISINNEDNTTSKDKIIFKNCSRCGSLLDKKENNICENCSKKSMQKEFDKKASEPLPKKGNLFDQMNEKEKSYNQYRTEVSKQTFIFQTLNSKKEECYEFNYKIHGVDNCEKLINFVSNIKDFSILKPKIEGAIKDITIAYEKQRMKLTFKKLKSLKPGKYNITILLENSQKISIKPININITIS